MFHLNKKFFLSAIFALALALPCGHAFSATGYIGGPSPAITGGGGNLTSFSGNTGSVNNQMWNAMMNPNKGHAGAPTADFGNCNSVILRCAQPKCGSGGCTDMEVASAIVRGCVQSNTSCKQYGEDLVSAISAQMVAQSTARANEQQAYAAAAAADAAAIQSSQQMQEMQMQLQQMQNQIAAQNSESAMRVEQALAQQQQLMAEQASAAVAKAAAAPAAEVQAAIDRGVSADVLARNQAAGAILTKLEDVNAALKNAQASMRNAFEYAGCNMNGENCRGPARVSAFKQKAGEFFDPFENVQDQVYDALIQAQALGVDITDIYMMLNGSCNVWGKYLCNGGSVQRGPDGKVAAVQPYCQLIQMLTNSEEVQQNWLEVQGETDGQSIQVACASDALDNSKFFANRRKKIDDVGIDDLAMILGQDATINYTTYDVYRNPCFDASNPAKTSSSNLQSILMTGRAGVVPAGGATLYQTMLADGITTQEFLANPDVLNQNRLVKGDTPHINVEKTQVAKSIAEETNLMDRFKSMGIIK